jgi:uncharacterized protein
MIEKIIKKLERRIKSSFSKDSSGHDIHHLKRVLNLALFLQKENGGDKLVIAIAAFLHDIHRIMEYETGRFCSPVKSLSKIKELIKEIKLSDEQKKKILHVIKYHEEYNFSRPGKKVSDLETLIVQDADNLDAMGAVGIGRAFSFGGSHNLKMWAPERPFNRKYFTESEKDCSTIHHFYSKLLRLKNNMNTKTGRLLADKRHKFMKIFLQEFFAEWRGRK